MSTKHTPGPWTIDCDGDSLPIVSAKEGFVAFVRTNDADARLIAAAPDLLEALQFLLDSEVNGWDLVPGQDKARAAIARATGTQED